MAEPADFVRPGDPASFDPADAFARFLHAAPTQDLQRFTGALGMERLGRADEAAAAYAAIADGPLRPLALRRMAGVAPGQVTTTLSDEIAAADPVWRGDGVAQSDLFFDLADALDAGGAFDDAFAAYAAGNAMVAAGRNLARAEAQDVARHDAVREIFIAERLAADAGQGHPSAAPIFVVGLPRSGSTLIEQILATHPKVQGLGEADALTRAAEGLYPIRPWAEHAPDHFRRLGAQYLNGMRAWGWDGKRRFVDKFPPNYLAVGLIALMFPRAVILHSAREAMDTCLSNYRHRFATNDVSYDLACMGRSYVRYRQVMAHWARVLPGRVIDVDHETLVADPSARIRWLVTEACGLSWHERCLAFHDNPRPVGTLSRRQVRQPIFSSSIGRWRRYEAHLGPLIEALGPWGPSPAARRLA